MDGEPPKVKPSLRDVTLEALVLAHPAMKRAAEMRREAVDLRRESRAMTNPNRRKDAATNAVRVWEEGEEMEEKAMREILTR